jgi:hypothetical protein
MKRSSNSTTKGFISQTILMLMITLFGFSYQGLAQMNCKCVAKKDSKEMSCTCSDKNAKVTAVPPKAVAKVAAAPCPKPVKHKAVAHKRKRVSTEKVAFKPKTVMSVNSYAATAPACENACWGYRKNNIYVTICPGLMFDRNDRLVTSSDRSWSGYGRSQMRIDTLKRLVPILVAPQSNVIDNYDGPVAPTSGNFTTPDIDYRVMSDGDFKIKSEDRKIKSEDYKLKIKD